MENQEPSLSMEDISKVLDERRKRVLSLRKRGLTRFEADQLDFLNSFLTEENRSENERSVRYMEELTSKLTEEEGELKVELLTDDQIDILQRIIDPSRYLEVLRTHLLSGVSCVSEMPTKSRTSDDNLSYEDQFKNDIEFLIDPKRKSDLLTFLGNVRAFIVRMNQSNGESENEKLQNLDAVIQSVQG